MPIQFQGYQPMTLQRPDGITQRFRKLTPDEKERFNQYREQDQLEMIQFQHPNGDMETGLAYGEDSTFPKMLTWMRRTLEQKAHETKTIMRRRGEEQDYDDTFWFVQFQTALTPLTNLIGQNLRAKYDQEQAAKKH